VNSRYTANDDELDEEQFVSVTVAYSEVLQLQGNVSEALSVVVKLLEDLEANNNEGNERHVALCNRRAAVLYKLAGKSAEAEVCVRQYISLIKDNRGDIKDLAYAYALLATIIEESGGRSQEALAMDKMALSLTTKED
jgi:tetratricopeptide (TPR) repeat protein